MKKIKEYLEPYRDYILPLVIALFGLIFLIHGLGWAYPQPVGYVNDFASIIPDNKEPSLVKQIEQLKVEHEVQVAIVTVPSLEGKDAETYARELGNAWGVGVKGKDNGLILLIAPNEKKWFFKTGYGMEAMLPDSRLGTMGREIFVPTYRKGDVAGAFGLLISQINTDLNRYKAKQAVQVTDPVKEKSNFPVEIFVIGGVVLGALLATWGIAGAVRRRRKIGEKAEEKKEISVAPAVAAALLVSSVTHVSDLGTTEAKKKKNDDDDDTSIYRSSSSSDDDDDHHSHSSGSSWDSGSSWGGGGGGFGGGSFGGGGAGGDL